MQSDDSGDYGIGLNSSQTVNTFSSFQLTIVNHIGNQNGQVDGEQANEK